MNAFREIFEQCFLVIGGFGLVLTLTALFLCAWNCWVSERISALCAAWKRSSFVTRVVSVAFVGILMAYASTKPPENGQEGRYLCLVSSLPEGQSEAPDPDPHRGETILTREWNLPGAWQYSMRRQDFAGGFVFPYGTNHLACVHVSSQGSVRETRFSTNVIASVGVPLAVVPGLTECSHEYTVSNTYRFVWANAAACRDTNTLVSASVELFRNGDVVVTTNGITRTIPRELPFEHDGYGQDESWVRANYDNADEILSVGYANWVDAQVGIGLTNGLYKFTARFEDEPPEPTQLYIGDYSVCVTNAGEYVFVLEKGTEYEFGTWPFNDGVEYWAQDDLAADAPMLTAWWGGGWMNGEWSVDGCGLWFWRPSVDWGLYYAGYCAWWPTFQGTPDLSLDGRISFPMTFSALFDYPGADLLTYHWTASDRNVRFSHPHSRSTMVLCEQEPRWGELNLTVSTSVGEMEFSSSLHVLYGTNTIGRQGLSCCCPEYFDTHRSGEPLTPVTLAFTSPEPTNGVVRALGWTHGGLALYYDRDGMEQVPDVFEQELVDAADWKCTLYAKGEMHSEAVGDGEIMCYFADGREFSEDDVVRETYTVVDRSAEPIISRPKSDSDPVRYYNPCCAKPNSVVHLCAFVEPSAIPDSLVSWRCVSGGADFVSSSTGRDVAVRMGTETAVFEIVTTGVLSSSRPMRLTVHVVERQ